VGAFTTSTATLPAARYVRISTPAGFGGILSIADVEVLGADGVTNVALLGGAGGSSQSASSSMPASAGTCGALSPSTVASQALDGDLATAFVAKYPGCGWWIVDLGAAQPVSGVRIWPATLGGGVNSSALALLDASGSTQLWAWALPAAVDGSVSLFFSSSTTLGFATDAFGNAGGALSLGGGTFISAPAPLLPLPTGNAAFSVSAWVRCLPWPGTITVAAWGTPSSIASGTTAAALQVVQAGAGGGSAAALTSSGFALAALSAPALSAAFASGGGFSSSLAGVAADAAGRTLYVADLGAHVIVAVNLDSRAAAVWCGSNAVSGRVVNGACTSAGFAAPFALTLDATRGTLYVTDGGVLRSIPTATKFARTVLALPGVSAAAALGCAVNPLTGAVLITSPSDNWLWTVSTSGAVVATQLAVSFTFSNPSSFAVAADGTVFVADSGSGRVLQLSASGDAVAAIIASGLSGPQALAFDGLGRLLIAENGAGRVQRFSRGAAGALAPLVGGFGSPSFVTVDSATGTVIIVNGGSATSGSGGASILATASTVSPLPICDATWHHLALVHGDLALAAYVDGALVGAAADLYYRSSPGSVTIGAGPSTSSV
jgi:hypothetical protein